MKNVTRIVSILLLACAMVTVTGLTSCASQLVSQPSAPPVGSDAPVSSEVPAAAEGTTLLIYMWNDEFKGMFENYYLKDHPLPAGVEYEIVINPSQDNEYQQKLDEAILSGRPIDIFLMEADSAVKYVNSDATKDLKSLGITDADLANQYEYTRAIATDKNGVLKGSSWQAAPGLFVYRRSFARDIFGTDDPAEMQELLRDWDRFSTAAELVKTKSGGKITMLSGFDDSYRIFSNSSTKPWVDESNTIQIDDRLWDWVDQTKAFSESGYNAQTTLWDDAWTQGQTPAGRVFGYFYSTWGITWTLAGNSLKVSEADGGKLEVGNGIYGDWAAIEGPNPYFWGGTWIAAGANGDNDALVADIIKYFTVDTISMQRYAEKSLDYVNNKQAIRNIIDNGFTSDFLGGQNHYSLLYKSAEAIKLPPLTAYDQGCNEAFQSAFKDYFTGTVENKATALDSFYAKVLEKYPNLSR